MDRFAKSLLSPINPAAIIILGVYTVVWGLWLISPWWSVFSTAPVYSALYHWAPEWAWGANAVFCGSITAWGALTRRDNSLLTGSFVAFIHWFLIALFYFAGDWMNTAGITALTLAIYAGFIHVNIKVNKGKPTVTIVDKLKFALKK